MCDYRGGEGECVCCAVTFCSVLAVLCLLFCSVLFRGVLFAEVWRREGGRVVGVGTERG